MDQDLRPVGPPRQVGAPPEEAPATDGKAGPTVARTMGVFVGRQREMGELQAALEVALSGQGRLVMLAGEPGIGKTRTAQELIAYATVRGAQVLWGRCHAAEGAPPYWPWVQVIRSYIHGRDPEELRSQMGAGAADVAEVVLELKEVLPDLGPPPALEPQQARFRLFDSITGFFKRASQSQPLMVVLDNLHWADRPSLQLLEFLAQEMAESRLLLLGTYRDQPERGHREMTIGIDVFRDPAQLHLHRMLVQPFLMEAGNYPINRRDWKKD